MPNIIMKDRDGNAKTYNNINTVRFKTPEDAVASYKYNDGDTYPTDYDYTVKFYDEYWEELLKEVRVDAGDSVTPPTMPEKENFEFVGWRFPGTTYSDSDFSTINEDMECVAYYKYLGEETSVEDLITVELTSESQQLKIYCNSINNGPVYVDWGDGSDVSSLSGTSNVYTSHTYSLEIGSIVLIKVYGSLETTSWILGYNNNNGYNFFCQTTGPKCTEICLHQGMTSIYKHFLAGINGLKKFKIPNTVTSITTPLTYSTNARNCDILIPPSVTMSYYSGFGLIDYKSHVGNVQFGEGVTSVNACIGRYAYIEHIILPDSLITIGDAVANYCNRIGSIVVPKNVGLTGKRICYGNSGVLVQMEKIMFLADEVKDFNESFIYLSGTERVFGVFATLKYYTFYGCYKLKLLPTLKGITEVANYAIYTAPSLEEIILPDGVTTIANYAFSSCYSLRKIVIPGTVTSIGSSVFDSSNYWEDLYVYATTPPTLGGQIYPNGSSPLVHVPKDSLSAYKAATNWSSLASYMVGDL